MRKPGQDHSEPQSVDMLRKLGYEASDVSLGVLMKWLSFLFIFIGGTSILTLLIYWVFVTPPPEGHTAAGPVNKLPVGSPTLQTSPKVDIREFRLKEEAKYSGYGWEDKAKGIAYVPVEEKLAEIAASGTLPKAVPGAGVVKPARGEDITAPGTIPTNANGAIPGGPNPGAAGGGPATAAPEGASPAGAQGANSGAPTGNPPANRP
jgi:hypothetical protein